jgi:protein ImuA
MPLCFGQVSRFDLYAPDLEQTGLPPGRVIFAEGPDDRDVLALMEDGVRHGGLADVVGEVRRADMTASQHLQPQPVRTGRRPCSCAVGAGRTSVPCPVCRLQ